MQQVKSLTPQNIQAQTLEPRVTIGLKSVLALAVKSSEQLPSKFPLGSHLIAFTSSLCP